MTAWDGAGGAISGLTFGLLVLLIAGSPLTPLGACMGFLYGGILGLGLGLLEGLALTVITRVATRRSADRTRYRIGVYGVNLSLTAMGSLLWFAGITISLGAANPLGYTLYTLIPTIIALVISLAASTHVVRTVEETGILVSTSLNREPTKGA